MRKYAVLAAAAGMALAGVAKADFVVTDNVTHSGGNDIHTFQVVNNGLNGTGSKLLAVDATLQAFQGAASATATPNGTLKLMTYDAQQGAGSGAIDDLDMSNITGGTNDRSFVRAGTATQWQIVS